ncbi:androgen-induced gene 1 protein-like [Panulirus ornatus]|uniref:androgen-induced gene 1 protein-like n=1 Tax=Panulirus ornatus TaxID=150431 RepID=UPI003A8C58CC
MELRLHLVHFGVFLVYVCGLCYDVKPPKGSEYESAFWAMGGRFKYLTFIDALLQCGFFGLCVLNDIVGSDTAILSQQSVLQKLRDWLFTSLVFPMGVFVSFIFWVLYAVDRELIFPASLDKWFPSWLNHIMHTLPAVGAFLELYMVCHNYQKGWNLYVPIIVAYFLYLSWICFIAYAANFWVYPVFEVLDFTGRTLFLAALLLPNLIIVFMGQKLHDNVWGIGTEQTQRKGKME